MQEMSDKIVRSVGIGRFLDWVSLDVTGTTGGGLMRIKAQKIRFKCQMGQSQKHGPKSLKEDFNGLVKEFIWVNPAIKEESKSNKTLKVMRIKAQMIRFKCQLGQLQEQGSKSFKSIK